MRLPRHGRIPVFQSALIVVAMRWSDRLIGFASTLILARLLTPNDFGLVAMATVVAGLVDVLLDLGVNAALIQSGSSTRTDYDTAWTIGLGQALIAATIIFLLASPAATYYNQVEVANVLRVMSVAVLIGAFQNIGIVDFQKNMEFGRDLKFYLARRLIGLAVTIPAAFILRSYWALVLGSLVLTLAGVGLSYAMHPYRPRLSLGSFKKLWAFSQWMLVTNIGNYAYSRIDKLVIGRRSGAVVTGVYSLADEISSIPTSELLAPLGRVMFPAFVSVRDDVPGMQRAFIIALAVQVLVGVPAAAGLAAVADTAVPLLLGDKWTAAVPFVQVLSAINVLGALGSSAGYALIASGRIRANMAFSWTRVLVFSVLAFLLFPSSDALQIAIFRLVAQLVGTLLFIAAALRMIGGITVGRVLDSIWRPFVATGVMTAAVFSTKGLLPQVSLFSLAAQVSLGALTYGFTVFVLWLITGRQEGGEEYLLAKTGLMHRLPRR